MNTIEMKTIQRTATAVDPPVVPPEVPGAALERLALAQPQV